MPSEATNIELAIAGRKAEWVVAEAVGQSNSAARRRTTVRCGECGHGLIAPERSEYVVGAGSVRHRWRCPKCSSEFYTSVVVFGRCTSMSMSETIARLNIEHFRRKLAEESNDGRRETLQRLLAEEEAKLAALVVPLEGESG
jgi:DNA-directed RNA polymerase subunit RPC12/RpoP